MDRCNVELVFCQNREGRHTHSRHSQGSCRAHMPREAVPTCIHHQAAATSISVSEQRLPVVWLHYGLSMSRCEHAALLHELPYLWQRSYIVYVIRWLVQRESGEGRDTQPLHVGRGSTPFCSCDGLLIPPGPPDENLVPALVTPWGRSPKQARPGRPTTRPDRPRNGTIPWSLQYLLPFGGQPQCI